jgi:hypothetical protein
MDLDEHERRKRLSDYGYGASSPRFHAVAIRTQQMRLARNQFEYAAILASAEQNGVPIPKVDGSNAAFRLPDALDDRRPAPLVALASGLGNRAQAQRHAQ